MKDFEWKGLALVLLLLTAVLYFQYNSYSKCETKGGAYVQGQCLKVEVIK